MAYAFPIDDKGIRCPAGALFHEFRALATDIRDDGSDMVTALYCTRCLLQVDKDGKVLWAPVKVEA